MPPYQYRVFDDRTNETLFTAFDRIDCALFIEMHYDENTEDYKHLWVGKIR